MKIRNGFVSNSSSSSFMIYGTYIEKDEVTKLAKAAMTPEEIQDVFFYDGEELDRYDVDFYSVVNVLTKTMGEGIHARYSYDDDGAYIGASFTQIKDDETAGQFKARVANALKKVFGDDVQVDLHEGVIYN